MEATTANTVYIVKALTDTGVAQLGAFADPAEAAAVQATYPGKARVEVMNVDFDVTTASHLS